MNSDPVKKKGASDGNLMYFEAEDTSLLMKRLKKDEFEIQPWTRLSAKIVTGGGTIEATSATCQYSIVTEDPEDMARVLVEFKGNRELQRGTGILIATGAGTTGWYKGASKYVSPNRYRLSRMEREAKFVLREPFEKEDILPNEITKYKMHSLLLQEDEEIHMTYFTHNEGRLSNDTQTRYRLARGNKIVVKIAETPLRVITIYN